MRDVRAEAASSGSAAPDAIGPTPLIRAVVGLLLGVAAGVVAALLLPRSRSPQESGERAV